MQGNGGLSTNAVNVAAKGPEYANAFSSLGQGWVGEEAVAIAVWAALLYPKDLKSAVVKAVNHSGDSDSTGAVCGYIVGTALGEEAIPKVGWSTSNRRAFLSPKRRIWFLLFSDMFVVIPFSHYHSDSRNNSPIWREMRPPPIPRISISVPTQQTRSFRSNSSRICFLSGSKRRSSPPPSF